MLDHSLSPANDQDLDALVDRLGGLRTRVLLSTEWHSILSAAHQLLPRKGWKGVVQPAEVDLEQYRLTAAGRVLTVVANAFASQGTFQTNTRYTTNQWITLIRDHYALCPYVLALPRVEYAAQLLRASWQRNKQEFWTLASIIVRIEPLVVRQEVRNEYIDDWEVSTIERLQQRKQEGQALLVASEDSDSVDQNEYDDWLSSSEGALSHAKEFLGAFQRPLPTEVDELESLIDEVPRPPDEDERDPRDDQTASRVSSYWTIERIFEDL